MTGSRPASVPATAASGTTPLLVERSRAVIRVRGRDPVRMIQGLATADIAAASPDRGVYTTFLTVKGRMVADARVFVLPGTAGTEPPVLILDAAAAAGPPLLAHIAHFVPPLFARAEDVSGDWAVVGLYGSGASAVVAGLVDGGPGEGRGPGQTAAGGRVAEAAPEETVVPLSDDGGFAVRTLLVGADGWDLFVPAGRRQDVIDGLLAAGARAGTGEALEALRVVAGRPRWGRELGDDVIPLEAGLLDRAISQTKGCYTGQEVIVRILHRGHVNRHLRRLVFEAGAPEPGTALFEPGGARPRGTVTSAVENDAGALGLGYVRREIAPPAELRVGGPDGPAVRVEALE